MNCGSTSLPGRCTTGGVHCAHLRSEVLIVKLSTHSRSAAVKIIKESSRIRGCFQMSFHDNAPWCRTAHDQVAFPVAITTAHLSSQQGVLEPLASCSQ